MAERLRLLGEKQKLLSVSAPAHIMYDIQLKEIKHDTPLQIINNNSHSNGTQDTKQNTQKNPQNPGGQHNRRQDVRHDVRHDVNQKEVEETGFHEEYHNRKERSSLIGSICETQTNRNNASTSTSLLMFCFTSSYHLF